jgi:aldehyde:ferredoxin oxidoreductase
MNGWVGTVLRVNLTDRSVRKEPLDMAAAERYLGGRGLGTYYYVREVDPQVDPLSEENKLIFATGPLTGTLATSSGRFDVVTKAPLTGAIAASNSGGYFGPELKFAGYDMVIFEGKAEKPVYLYVDNESVEIRDAAGIWGRNVPEATDLLLAATDPEAKVACIGPAGEKLALLANIMNDKHRAPGRGGVGAVMGSKNLKALVVRGTKGVSVADKEGFLAAVKEVRAKMAAAPVTGAGLPAYGTNILVNILNQVGGLPTKNFQTGYFETADKVGGESLASERMIRNKGCFGCIIGCGRVAKSRGAFEGSGEGPEYETAWSFGPDCGIDDLDAVLKANFLCNELGIDTISLGSTVACAMELYEMGALTKEQTGVELPFGAKEAMVKLVEDAGNVRGFGAELAQGSARLAAKYGHPELSMSVKKQEMPAYDPRLLQGLGLNYATSNRGGCHVRGYMTAPEILGIPQKLDPDSLEEKPAWTKLFQDLTAAVSASGMCLFTTLGIGGEEIVQQLNPATGLNWTVGDFVKAGERIWNLERLYNLKAGFSAADDQLPPRLTKDPIPSGPAKGRVSHVPEMLPRYYEARGWDEKGVPSPEKVRELDLEFYA